MTNFDSPHITESDIYRMSTGSLIVLANWARAKSHQTDCLSNIDLYRLYGHSRDAWREHVTAIENWRFLADRCNSALIRRGVW